MVTSMAKPYTAMLIARSVEEQEHGGDRTKQVQKCTCPEFADIAGISPNTVRKYLRTWEAMAEAGVVSVTRVPGNRVPGTSKPGEGGRESND